MKQRKCNMFCETPHTKYFTQLCLEIYAQNIHCKHFYSRLIGLRPKLKFLNYLFWYLGKVNKFKINSQEDKIFIRSELQKHYITTYFLGFVNFLLLAVETGTKITNLKLAILFLNKLLINVFKSRKHPDYKASYKNVIFLTSKQNAGIALQVFLLPNQIFLVTRLPGCCRNLT